MYIPLGKESIIFVQFLKGVLNFEQLRRKSEEKLAEKGKAWKEKKMKNKTATEQDFKQGN